MITGKNFSDALCAAKEGKLISRDGWNGKNMHVFLESRFDILMSTGENEISRQYEPVFCLWTAQQTTQPGWLPSQADLLAEDWCILD